MNPKLPSTQRLSRMITDHGDWLSFESFMGAALYSPDGGYYTQNVRAIGRRGDFSTAAGKGSLLGQAVAQWVSHQRRRVQCGRRWHFIETGGGDGSLAREILSSLGWWGRKNLTYHLVEISPALEKMQQAKLKGFRVRWHAGIGEALAAAEGRAILFSNELVDAFPCLRLRWSGLAWEEMGIVCREEGIAESPRPPGSDALASLESSATASFPGLKTGQMVEVHRAYRTHLEKIAAGMVAGVILTVDYGDVFPEIYHRRPQGTVRGYFHHVRMDGGELYQRFGHQDLTADVNFTDLQNWGERLGFSTEEFLTQREFILRWRKDPRADSMLNVRLLDADGAGAAFKVLQQCRLPG